MNANQIKAAKTAITQGKNVIVAEANTNRKPLNLPIMSIRGTTALTFYGEKIDLRLCSLVDA